MNKHRHILKILIFDMFIIEFGPVGVFFVVYYFSNFLTATLALGLSTLVALVLSKVVNRRVPWFAIFSGSVTMLTALITYVFIAPWILIVKDSIYYVLFALLLGVSIWKKRSVFKSFFGHVFAMDEIGWRILERRWFVFFLLAGAANEFVRVFLTAEQWVVYKQIIVIVFLIFGLYQFRVSSTHRLPEADALGLRRTGEHE